MATSKPRITAWSYSRWQCYEECPRKAKYKFIDKLKEPGSAAMDRGTAIHKMAEDYITGKTSKLATELKLFQHELAYLKKAGAQCEQEWAFTSAWQPTGWFDNDAWWRVKTDVCLELTPGEFTVQDHKTGKYNDSHHLQLDAYGLAAFLKYPHAETVYSVINYLDIGPNAELPTEKAYDRKQLPALKKDWIKRTKPMLSDTTFAPRPGNYCRWCHFRKGNGGPCQF